MLVALDLRKLRNNFRMLFHGLSFDAVLRILSQCSICPRHLPPRAGILVRSASLSCTTFLNFCFSIWRQGLYLFKQRQYINTMSGSSATMSRWSPILMRVCRAILRLFHLCLSAIARPLPSVEYPYALAPIRG